MSGFTDFQASDASDTARRSDVIHTWTRAQSMLPLVRRILEDIQRLVARMHSIQPEKDRLDRQRHDLVWQERHRRYQLTEELAQVQTDLQAAVTEMDILGVVLLDVETGMIGFPTLVNNQRAYFSWKPTEETIDYWQFADNWRRRTVPAAWKDVQPVASR